MFFLDAQIFEREQRYEWKRQHLKMYVALNMRDFHFHSSSHERDFFWECNTSTQHP